MNNNKEMMANLKDIATNKPSQPDVGSVKDDIVVAQINEHLLSTEKLPAKTRRTKFRDFYDKLEITEGTRQYGVNAMLSLYENDDIGLRTEKSLYTNKIKKFKKDNDNKGLLRYLGNFIKKASDGMITPAMREYNNIQNREMSSYEAGALYSLILKDKAKLEEMPDLDKLDGQVGDSIHLNDWACCQRSMHSGTTKVENGRFKVMTGPDEWTAGSLLSKFEDMDRDIIDELYIKPQAQSFITKGTAANRKDQNHAKKERVNTLYNEMSKLPTDLRYSIALDKIEQNNWDPQVLRDSIYDMVKYEIDDGNVKSPRETLLVYKNIKDKMGMSLAERMGYGTKQSTNI